MEKEADKYCEKIVMAIIITGKIRLNKLYNILPKLGAQMSKPTLMQHLGHLTNKDVIQRVQEGKQKVTYDLNWTRFTQLKKAKKTYQTTLAQAQNEKTFKSQSLDQQTTFTTATLTIGELNYLKMQILNILEPENKIENYFTYTITRRLYNIYAQWLLDSCKKSEENSQKVICSIDKSIKSLTEDSFEHYQQ